MAGGLKYKPQPGAVSSPRPPVARVPVTRNVETVLGLGGTRYFRLRTLGLFGVPALPYRAGQLLVEVFTYTVARAKLIAEGKGTAETEEQYYNGLDHLQRLLWKYSFPAGKLRRLVRRLGFLSNPYRNATERELLDIADFFLKGRMRSTVQFFSMHPDLPEYQATRMR